MTQQVVLSSTSSSFTYGWTYDVFLSFRGEDTRFSFTGNLYNSLNQRGIHTFIDDEELKRGEELTPALHKAIQESRIAIIIFSENYASSTFCLEELVKILEQENRLVWPIFYKVDPSEVRHQRGSYGEALSKHQRKFKKDKEKVQKWKLSLRKAADLSGWHFIKDGHEYEYQFIENIVKEVSTKLNRTPLHIGDYPVGLESRLLEINSLLQVGSNDEVNMVGIHGIGGIGKTTSARAVYNLIADQFESLCFLGDVREKYNSKDGLVQLQERLLFELVGDRDIKLGDVSRGITKLKHRFQTKKVLVVLDNVDRKEQLQALVGGCDWFGPGSRIIITTRDKHLLDFHGVKKTYEVQELNYDESLNLLSWNAFRGEEPDSCYLDSLKAFVDYAKGLPLALEIIGSNLHGKTIDVWNSLLCLYRINMNEEVEGILKVSYDGLEKHQREIFLDIACFFNRHSLDYVKEMLRHIRDVPSDYSIGVLIDKSLLKIDELGRVQMHDLIQDMGKGIVRKQSPKEPGKRSRLWSNEDIVHVLEENTGTDEVEVIIQKSWNCSGYSVQWNGKAFKKMRKLKVLIIENVSFCSGVQYLPNSLRFLEWVGYPSPCLPPDFRPKKLSLLNLEQSCISSLKPLMGFMDLNILNLDDCKLITQIPDISCFPNLTELSFRCCDNLVEVHDSVGFLDKLRILRACSCPKLRTLPPLAMSTLEKLRLRNCSSLEAFPDILGEKKKITELDLDDTDLVFPSSIQNLTGLRILDMQNCRRIQLPIHIAMLPELELLHIRVCGELLFSKQDEGIEKGSFITCPKMDRLVMDLCNISDESLSLCLSWFVNVKTMSLLGSNFTILPACINKCPFLTWLDLENCKHLREIRGVPPNIQYLSAKNCTSLSSESTSILLSEELHNTGGKIFSLPQATIPEWFDHRTEGGSISFWFRNKFPVLVVCVVIGLTNEDFFCIKFDPHVIINGNNRFCARGFVHTFRVVADHIFVFDLRSIEFSDKVEDASLEKEWNRVEICYGDPFDSTKEWVPNMVSMEEVGKESGIYVLKEINKMEDIRFTNPYMDNGICSHALSEQGYSTGPDSSDSIDTEEDLSDTSVNHVELQLKRRGKMKVDDNLPSQAEAETIDTQFPESRVNIGLVHVLRKEDKSLSWDGMEGEDQVLCLKNKPILNDQCTMCERDKDGMGCESSKQRRHSRHRCLRALLLFSFVALFLFFFDSIMISSRLYPSSP